MVNPHVQLSSLYLYDWILLFNISMDWFSREKQITGNTISYHIAFEWEIRWSLLIRFSQENQSIEYRNICWLVVSNMKSIFHFIYGMSSFPLTNSYIFQECYCTTNQYFGEWFNHIFLCHEHLPFLQVSIFSARCWSPYSWDVRPLPWAKRWVRWRRYPEKLGELPLLLLNAMENPWFLWRFSSQGKSSMGNFRYVK